MSGLYTLINKKNANQIPSDLKVRLTEFESQIPAEYQIAAKEGVNNKKERITRQEHLERLFT